MADAARECFDNFDSKDAFLALYPRIAFELDNGALSDSFGTEEDVAFDSASGMRVFVKKRTNFASRSVSVFAFACLFDCSPRYASVSALCFCFAK